MQFDQLKRREVITLLGSAAAAWPLAAHAQTTKAARIGFLGLGSASSHASRTAAFRAGLRDLGWIEGGNLLIEFRWAEDPYRTSGGPKSRAAASPDLILADPI